MCGEERDSVGKSQGCAFSLNPISYHLGDWGSWTDRLVDHRVL